MLVCIHSGPFDMFHLNNAIKTKVMRYQRNTTSPNFIHNN